MSSTGLQGILLALALLAIALVPAVPAQGGRTDLLNPPHLSWTDDPGTTVTIAWATQDREPGSRVRYGSTDALGMVPVDATSAALVPGYRGFGHVATLRGLSPNTTYYYSVGSDTGGWTEVNHFATVPPAGAPVRFLAFADMGTTREAQATVQAMAAQDYTFSIHAGDISYAGGNQGTWNSFVQQIAPLASSHPYMTTVGNHENESRVGHNSYLNRFPMPSDANPQDPRNSGLYYSFNVSSVHLVALKTDYISGPNFYPDRPDFDPVQTRWLERDLAAAVRDPLHPWIVVYFHYPPFSSGLDHGSWLEGRRTWSPLFDRYQVALVITGHDHLYERTYPVWSNATVADRGANETFRDPGAPVYIVAGGGGESHDRFRATDPWSARRSLAFHFVEVQAAPGTLVTKAVDSGTGKLLDCFAIVRGDAPADLAGFCHGVTPPKTIDGGPGAVAGSPWTWAAVAGVVMAATVAGVAYVARRAGGGWPPRRRG